MKSKSDRLTLVLTFQWFDKVASGEKRIEYRRLCTTWEKQIWQRRDQLQTVNFHRGMTAQKLTFSVQKIDIGPCPIPGWDGNYYRIHFSD